MWPDPQETFTKELFNKKLNILYSVCPYLISSIFNPHLFWIAIYILKPLSFVPTWNCVWKIQDNLFDQCCKYIVSSFCR